MTSTLIERDQLFNPAKLESKTFVPPSAIDFWYSDVVNPLTYETEGLCVDIPLRRHRDIEKENLGALRAQEDWTKLVRPVPNYKGGLSAKCSFVQVTVPECLPERLEVISYANEFAFLYDGDVFAPGFLSITLTLYR